MLPEEWQSWANSVSGFSSYQGTSESHWAGCSGTWPVSSRINAESRPGCPCGSAVLPRWQKWERCSPDKRFTVSLQPPQTRGCMFPARGVPMCLEGEGVFPWGPGHVSLPYLVSEGPIHTLALTGGGVGVDMGCRIMSTI